MANVFTSGDVGGNWWQEVDRLQTKLYDLEMRLKTYQSLNDEEIKRVYKEIDLIKQELSLFKTETRDNLSLLEVNKANKNQEKWINATLLNNWGADYPVKFYKDNFGTVIVKGRLHTGEIGTTAFQLPSGYTPLGFPIGFSCMTANDKPGKIQVQVNGNVVVNSYDSYIFLDNVRFSTL